MLGCGAGSYESLTGGSLPVGGDAWVWCWQLWEPDWPPPVASWHPPSPAAATCSPPPCCAPGLRFLQPEGDKNVFTHWTRENFLSQIFVKFGYVMNSRKIKTLYFAQKNVYKKQYFCIWCRFLIFHSIPTIVFYIILKLWPLKTQDFLNYRNILSSCRDIRKRKKEKFLNKIFEKV